MPRHPRIPLAACLALALVGTAAAGGRKTTMKKAKDCLPTARRTLSACYRPGAGPVPVAFFDADSTLRVSKSGSVSANHPTDVLILPRVARKLRKLLREGWLIAIVSNQGGVAAGFIELETADAALRHTMDLLAEQGVVTHYYDFAEAKDEYRKPATGMARLLAEALEAEHGRAVDWHKSFMVGDSGWKRKKDTEPFGTPGEDFSNSDRGFAENVRRERKVPGGFRFYHPRDYFGWSLYGVRNFRNHKDLTAFREEHPHLE